MQRTQKTFTVESIDDFKSKLLVWAQQFDAVSWLDSNQYNQKYSSFSAVLAVDEFTSIKTDYTNAFEKLKEYQSITNDYLFGYLSYDLKNDVENLSSKNFDGLDFADLYFFQPQRIIFINGNTVEFSYLKMINDEIDNDYNSIVASTHATNAEPAAHDLKIKLRIHKDEYYKKVNSVLNHINRGDIYEASFCQEFYAENATINPLEAYHHLNAISEPPFATFFKCEHQYLLSASPERYIKREGTKIVSQPIKGTAKRLISKVDDAQIAFDLSRDEKERSENIMIVDLVRNDLSKTAIKGSVKVEELCQVHSFRQVHQLVSTVVSEVRETTNSVDIIRDTFPMGSMTGAPKFSAMKIIEEEEETRRGLYSGAVGYFSPTGDFDFNVVIRSILYNEEKNYVSFSVGGAITSKSTPEKEYEECLLKAKAMKHVLTNSN